MGNLTRDSSGNERLGKTLVRTLPLDTWLFDRVIATKLGLVQTEPALAAVLRQTSLALPTARLARPLARVALAALPDPLRDGRQDGDVTSTMKGFGAKVTTHQHATVEADVAIVVVLPFE